MSVDKFGRHESSFVREVLRGPPGEGFYITQDGHYDLKKKRICNLGDPINDEEAVNLKSIRSLTLNCDNKGKIFDAKSKRITNIANAENDTDAVNRAFVLQEIENLKKEMFNKIENILKKFEKLDDFKSVNNRGNDLEEPLLLMTNNKLRR